jgi:hypothetical protein
MKKVLCLAILLLGAAAGYAAAGINIYITAEDDVSGAGQVMSNDQLPGERYDQTEQNFVPFFTSPGADILTKSTTAAPFVQENGTTKTYYLWADMTEDPNSVGATRVARLGIYGLDLSGCIVHPNSTIGQSAEYRQMDDGGNTRWTTAGEVPCFNGLQSLGNGLMSFVSTDLQFTTGTGATGRTTHALLGAFEFTAHGIGSVPQPGLSLKLGSIFAAVRTYKRTGTSTYTLLHDYDTTGGGYYPGLSINGVPYVRGVSENAQLAIVTFPEPTSLVLLGLAGLLIRRR